MSKKLGPNADYVFKKLYYDEGETKPVHVFRRVVNAIVNARPDLKVNLDEFIRIQVENKMRVNSPAMMNLGCKRKQIASACFVGRLEDSMSSIKGFYDDATEVFLAGSGIGANFSDLREKDCPLSSGGTSSGPIAFIRHLNSLGGTIKSGGKTRRAAAMVVFDVGHPDVIDVIRLKTMEALPNINISINLTDAFMKAVQDDTIWELRSVIDGSVKSKINAQTLLKSIAECAHACGDPGVVFLDRVNRFNTIPTEPIRSSNPCWVGSTKIWTVEGPKRIDELVGKEIPVLTQDDNGLLKFRTMRNIRQTASDAEVMKVVFKNAKGKLSAQICTPQHTFHLSDGSEIHAEDLRAGDSIGSVYRYKANQKGYLKLQNSVESVMEHHVVLEWKEGSRPSYPKEHAHHIDGDRSNNIPPNLEILDHYEHNSKEMFGESNPMYGVGDERNPFKRLKFDGEKNGRFREDIDTNKIQQMKSSGMSNKEIAKHFNCSPYLVAHRLGWRKPIKEVMNHKVVSIERLDIKAPVYNGSVDETHRYFVCCGSNDAILSANCGEQFLMPHGSCNLASVNIAAHIIDGQINWNDLATTVCLTTYMLDGMLDASEYPTEKFQKVALSTRNIGIGIMGLADALLMLNLPYDSPSARETAGRIMEFVTQEAWAASMALAQAPTEGGIIQPFTKFGDAKERLEELWGITVPVRNAQVTTIAPTGSISISCECSSGMEPLFAIVYEKKISDTGDTMTFVHPDFQKKYQNEKWYAPDLINEMKRHGGSIQRISNIPLEVKQLWKTAHDINWLDRVLMQAGLQKYVTNSISSTVNLPNAATADTILEIIQTAYEQGLKGVTVYRDGSITTQPVKFGGVVPELRRIKRPKRLKGVTDCVKTGEGNMYVTINELDGVPVECFVEIGKSGGNKKAHAEALGRMMSLNWQLGGSVQMIYEQLIGIAGKDVVWDEGKKVLSIYDGVAKVLWDVYLNPEQKSDANFYDECPQCHGRYEHKEGCAECLDCGYSKCQ